MANPIAQNTSIMNHDTVKLAFIGAGGVNFGGAEGPWDHASRFETIKGVECVGVADVDVIRASNALATRQAGPYPEAWATCQVFTDWRQMIEKIRPNAVVVGLQPDKHGQSDPPHDVEVTLARHGIAMLIEKPLGMTHPDKLNEVAQALGKSGSIISVGYMFRYSAAITKMRQVLEDTPGGPCVFLGRYNCAYSTINRVAWWDKRRSGGPIIEQATHFLDLARFICGEVDLDSIQVTTIDAVNPMGQLSAMPKNSIGAEVDSNVPSTAKIPRTTLAQWCFSNGAAGSLAHGLLLHQQRYEADLEVWADGVRCVLTNPYQMCRLGIRRSGIEETDWQDFDDDPYLTEDIAFIKAVRKGSTQLVRSTYADAMKTYRLSWTISDQSR